MVNSYEEGNRREPETERQVIVPEEFDDYLKVVVYGELKYAPMNYLLPDGSKSSFKDMHDSMFHHLAESFSGLREDKDTKLDPLLHLATRALMMYTRLKRNIKHPLD